MAKMKQIKIDAALHERLKDAHEKTGIAIQKIATWAISSYLPDFVEDYERPKRRG